MVNDNWSMGPWRGKVFREEIGFDDQYNALQNQEPTYTGVSRRNVQG